MDTSYRMRFLQALSHVRHFNSLPSPVQDALAEAAVLRHYPADEMIYLEGDPAEMIYILQSGWVKATRASLDGREQALLFLREGEVFGDIAVFGDVPFPGTVTALEPVDAWTIDKDILMRLINQHPEFALAVIRRLCERVQYYVGFVEDLSLRTVESRLAATLLKNAVFDEDRLVIPRRTWTTFDEMAVRLGTVRDVLARALRNLEQEGLLHVEKHSITILDREGLAERTNI